MSTGETWTLGHRPALDGLRGIAVLLVLGDHAGFIPQPAGSIGVAVFFVLSGFLISRVIIEAHEAGRWSFAAFFGNRAARLVPGLAVMVAVSSVLAVLVGAPADVVGVRASRALLYVQNFFMDPTVEWNLFRHAWSLAVEEQFYLVWPFALLLVLRRRRALVWVAAAVALSLLARFAVFAAGWHELAQTSLFGNAFALMLGAGLAMVRLRQAPRWVVPVGAAGLVGVLVVAPTFAAPFLVGPVVAAGFAVLLVWGGATSRSTGLEVAPLRFAGRISYALYLWHFPLLALYGWAFAYPATLAVATASTLLLEEPVRRRWRSRRRGAPVTTLDGWRLPPVTAPRS